MAETFPTRAHKEDQYGALGEMLADVAADIGAPTTDVTRERWAAVMVGIASVDDVIEAEDHTMTAPEMVEVLGMGPDDPYSVRAAQNLIDATRYTFEATDLDAHMGSRVEEAVACLHLLVGADPGGDVIDERDVQQLADLTAAGQMLDVVRDAREDVELFPQFSVRQLQLGGLKKLTQHASRMDRDTWRAAIRATHKSGLDRYLLRASTHSLLARVIPFNNPRVREDELELMA